LLVIYMVKGFIIGIKLLIEYLQIAEDLSDFA